MDYRRRVKSKKKAVVKRIFFVWLLINFMILVILVAGIYLIKEDNKVLRKDKGYIYISLQHESMPFDISVHDFEAFQKELLNDNYYDYYEIYGQPLLLENEIFRDQENSNITDEGQYVVDSVQIGKNVCKDFEINVRKGRNFEEADYMIDSEKKVPVLVGNDMAVNLEIGDTFSVEYLYDTYECMVIGILKPDSMLYMTNKIYLLDNRIIMPSFNISDESNVTDGIKIHYANKVSGIIKVEKGKEKQAIEYLESCIANTSTGKYSWYSTLLDVNLRQMFHVGIYDILFINIAVLILWNVCMRRTR